MTSDQRRLLDLCLPQTFDCGLRGDRRIINLFESVRPSLGLKNRENLDVPVVIVIECFPISESCRRMLAVGRSVEQEVEGFGDRADALQGPPQERGEIGQVSNARRTGALKG